MWRIDFDDVCEQILGRMEGALGCALVDLQTGLPLALDARSDSLITPAALEMISAAAVACFSDIGGARSGPESADARAAIPDNAPQQIQVTTEFTYNFMSLVPGKDGLLLILITNRGDSNLGLGWMAMRQALAHLSDAGDHSASAPLGILGIKGATAQSDE